jgi:uncharacterized protein YjbI with pentapeptide repeats
MIEVKGVTAIESPWPGPVPYTEEDAERFLGRANEVRRLLDLIARQQLNILIALSGVGKSSLLQAGLVPALRYLRETGRETGRDIGPVLLVRDWAMLREASPAAILVQAIHQAILKLLERTVPDDKQLRQDVRKLARVPCPSGESLADPEGALAQLVEYVHQLCTATGGLVLILDQAEELLGSGLPGSGQELEREVIRVVGTLFQKEKRLKLLLSLREEYLGRISLLARDVDGLDRRIFRLDPMPASTVKDVILKAAEITKNTVAFAGEEVVKTIIGWLGEGDSEAGADGETPVDLLRLQALLIGVFQQAQEETPGAPVLIDQDLLDRFMKNLEKKLGRQIAPRELAKQALENHLEKLLDEAEVTEPPKGPGSKLMRRVLVRMAPWLSSPGGFKRHVIANELVFNAIRDDLEILNLQSNPEEIRAAIMELVQNRTGLLKVQFESSGKDYLSGDAATYGWSVEQTATMLVNASLEVLDLLCSQYILKSSRGRTAVTYELVHDGFGPALFEWAERQRVAFPDTLASVVSRRGESFRWRSITDQTVREVSWLGCNLNDVIIRNVRFERCILTGTIFTSCILDNCVFDQCDLRGSVFQGGTWADVHWLASNGTSALFVGATWNGTTLFESTILDNATLDGLWLTGEVKVADSSLQFSQISKFQMDFDSVSVEIKGSDLQNALLEERRVVMGDDCNENGVLRRRSQPTAPSRGPLAIGRSS